MDIKEYNFVINKIIEESHFRRDDGVRCALLKVITISDEKIAFWGRVEKFMILEKNMINIELIKSSDLPLNIKIITGININASNYIRQTYGVSYSISEDILINT